MFLIFVQELSQNNKYFDNNDFNISDSDQVNNENLLLEVHGPRWANQQGFLHLSEEDSGCPSNGSRSSNNQPIQTNKSLKNEIVVSKFYYFLLQYCLKSKTHPVRRSSWCHKLPLVRHGPYKASALRGYQAPKEDRSCAKIKPKEAFSSTWINQIWSKRTISEFNINSKSENDVSIHFYHLSLHLNLWLSHPILNPVRSELILRVKTQIWWEKIAQIKVSSLNF